MHRVAEVAQFLDVTPHGPHIDIKALPELSAGPITRGLQQSEKPQQSGGGFQHARKFARHLGRDLS
ncbi:hypothetical protein GCM10022255_102070 [Dactylosporangium darangshiense]|uniref:Uncharacterized protein n=1 Tax=Dactylosporangium darangshiense TaxID=579108 RepID=A0ABP8DS68_9ACTN